MSPAMSAPPAFLYGRSVSAPFSRGLRLGRGCVPLGNVGRKAVLVGVPSQGLLQGGTAVEECYASRQMPPCTKTGNARLETAAQCMCPRSVLHRPSERAASAVAPQSLWEVKSVPSGSEKQSLREVKSAKCKVKSAARWPEAQCPHRASLIQNSKFSILNYHKA